MAGSSRRTNDSLVDQLLHEPYRFDFFQAVRILEAFGREWGKTGGPTARMPVGFDFAPEDEAVRFRTLPSRSFPAGAVSALKNVPSDSSEPAATPEMTISFMGLIGPGGVLPDHYTDFLVRRVREKDYALRDFLDLFNHRTVSLFYRAWLKYRFQFNYKRPADREDTFAFALKCLTGMGSDHMAGRTPATDETFLFYSGLFTSRARHAAGLADMLSDYFGIPVSVDQFRGHWLTLSTEECTTLPSGPERSGYYNRLGIDSVLGERVWDVNSRFRLRIGPLDLSDFNSLLPHGKSLQELYAITRTYVGPELDFDVQLVLAGDAVRSCRLLGQGTDSAALGWNSWLTGVRDGDTDDVCFRPEAYASHT